MERKINTRLAFLAALVMGTSSIVDSPAVSTKTLPDGEMQTATPEVVKSLERPRGVFERLIAPLVQDAERRRHERYGSDPEYVKRINWELNHNRLNVLFYGHGETHEPPLTERDFIGSITIASLQISERKISLISFTHDIRAPEIERYVKAKGEDKVNPIKIYRAFHEGGFDLMRQVLENATGLSIDYQFAFHDRVLKDTVDNVFGGVEVEVPAGFDVLPFYLDEKKYPAGSFQKGRERMNGLRILQFIKTVPNTHGRSTYPKMLEHNFRKHLFLDGAIQSAKDNIKNPIFLVKAFGLLLSRTLDKSLEFDFDAQKLLLDNLLTVTSNIGQAQEDLLPEMAETIYIVDPAHGDGGVRWVIGSQHPIVRREILRGRYPDLAMAVPFNGDPNAVDLAHGYWPSVRSLIQKRLSQ